MQSKIFRLKFTGIILLLIISSTLSSCGSLAYFNVFDARDVYIFSDIKECEGLEQLKGEDVEIVRYETPERDKKLKKLKYSDFYAAKYTSPEVEFEIFAYVFEDVETARKYFENHTGKDDKVTRNWSGSSDFFTHYTLVAFVDERAYVMKTDASTGIQAQDIINSIFSVEFYDIDYTP